MVTSGGVWKTPSPRAGISTPLFSVMVVVMPLTVGRYQRGWESLLLSPRAAAIGAFEGYWQGLSAGGPAGYRRVHGPRSRRTTVSHRGAGTAVSGRGRRAD